MKLKQWIVDFLNGFMWGLFLFLLGSFVINFITSCSSSRSIQNKMMDKLNELYRITGILSSIVESDYSTCPSTGDTTDPLIRKICNVAQAATIEVRTELKAELQVFVLNLKGQVDALANDVAQHRIDLDSLNSEVASLNSLLLSLDARITSAEAAIAALQALTSSITGVLAGTLISIEIGKDNPLAGPMYESVLRRTDRQRFNGYVESYGVTQSLPNAPLTASNGSSIVSVSLNSHGYSVNDKVFFQDLDEGRGFSSGHLYGEFIVNSVTNVNTFTIVLSINASSSGTFGGNVGLVRKVIGRGMSTLWRTGDSSDTNVRVSNLGSKRYNFIIRRLLSDAASGELCWDKTNNNATFGTINAASEGGSGNITCK